MKNFTIKKSILQVLLIDSIICIVSSFILIVVAAIFLAFPTNKVCGQLTYMLPHAIGCISTLLVRAHICVSDCIPQKHCCSRKHETKSANNQTASTLPQNLYHNLINHLSDNRIAVNWICRYCSSGNKWFTCCISSYIFCGNYSYSFLNFEFVANLKNAELFKEGNYSRAEDHFSTSKFYCFG